ncbi:MAG: UDP-N-acetylglucosamine 2-epimerase (non-hydrolyzing), partial [Bacteroidetes bacterium]|nr:UDP-N-acetylglucosamine 2-epimerase (non-hydrolyzing) [Bacteroidota bacterium]
NELVGSDPDNLSKYLRKIIDGNWKLSAIPALWDGKTSDRIVSALLSIYIK